MLDVRESQVLTTTAFPLLRQRPAPLNEVLQLKRSYTDALSDRESDTEILKVLERAAGDNSFIAQLTNQGAKALEPYKLSLQAKAALLSGDLRWIEARLGKLDARLRTWLDCRLGQEIW